MLRIASTRLLFFSVRNNIAERKSGSVFAAARAAASSSAVVGNALSTSATIRASDLRTRPCDALHP